MDNYERKMIVKLERSELEDKYWRFREENIDLKKDSQKQEDKIKRLGTKLIRLINDKKGQDDGISARKQDIKLEEIIQDLQDQNRDILKQNKQLKEKLILTKQQLATHSQRPSPYYNVHSRVDSGKTKGKTSPSIGRNKKLEANSPLPKYGLSLLEEARTENKNLEDVVIALREQVYILDQQNETLKEQMKIAVREYDEETNNLKAQMTSGQKKTIQGNVDFIRVQRDLKHKNVQLSTAEQENQSLLNKMEVLKSSNHELVSDIDKLNHLIKDLQNKNHAIESQKKIEISLKRNLDQAEEQITDLKQENIMLKEASDKLMNSSLDLKPARDNSVVEHTLRGQIDKLQTMLSNCYREMDDKKSPIKVTEKIVINEDKDGLSELKLDHEKILKQNTELRELNEELEDKLRIMSERSAVNITELETALTLVKTNGGQHFHIDGETQETLKKQIKSLESQNIETVNELEKTRNMLILQHRINRDYKNEVHIMSKQKNQLQTEFETRLQEYAKLLDIRAARIQKLEKQLKDIAYGTKHYQITDHTSDNDEESVELERGQNLFELHFDKVTFSPEVSRLLNEKEPSTFLTWAFYDFEISSTDIIKSSRPEYNHTSQYVVRADDSFLQYLLKTKTIVEMHIASGTDYSTVSSCQLDLKCITDNTQSRYHGQAQLMGKDKNSENIVFGVLDFWARLKIPMEQALRLFKERGKALGYININKDTARSALSILDETDNVSEREVQANQIHIKIIRCSNLMTDKESDQPSPFCIYAFHNSTDHVTTTLPCTNNPEYNDHNIITVSMNQKLDDYLKNQNLLVYVFDENDPIASNYVGVSDIPLISLVNGHNIDGTFEVYSEDKAICGTIDINIYFQYSYTYVPVIIGLSLQIQEDKKPVENPQDNFFSKTLDDKPISSNILSNTIVAGNVDNLDTPVPSPRSRKIQPTASSTPKFKKMPTEQYGEFDPKVLEFQDSPSTPKKEAPLKPEVAPRKMSLKSKEDYPSKELGSLSSPGSPLKSLDHNKPMSEPFEKSDFVEETEELEFSKEIEEISDAESFNLHDYNSNNKDNKISPIKVASNDEKQKKSSLKKGYVSPSESEDIVIKSDEKSDQEKIKDSIAIDVHHLTLTEDSLILDNPNIQMMFVEYKFLNYSQEELETPFALPKPKPGQKIAYHFHKVFYVDTENNYSKRQMLAAMLLPNSSDEIRFTVVSEPPDDAQEEMDCEDVGFAALSFNDILKSGDVKMKDISVLDHKDNIIGNLNVSVEAFNTLKKIQSELP